MEVIPCAQDEIPLMPVTLVTAKALTSLHTLIEQDAHTLDILRKQRLQRHVQKLANAARIPFAECVLLQDQNQFLSEINHMKPKSADQQDR